jgi:hypothetical protein
VTAELKLHDVVALLEDRPTEGLRRGQLGTIIDVYKAGAYEVEFADRQGQTYATLTLNAAQLIPIYEEPARAAG